MQRVVTTTLCLIALALATACEGFRKQPGLLEAVGVLPPPPTDLAVMSFNIRYGTANDGENNWKSRRDLLLGVIDSNAPDILGLQETLRFQIDEIRSAIPLYAETGVGRDDGKSAGEHCSILYRSDRFKLDQSGNFWLSDTPEIPGSKSWGNNITRLCSWVRLIERPGRNAGPGGRAFYVYNVHFDHESEPSRQRSAELVATRIVARAHSADAVILMGDFNCSDKSPALLFLTGQSSRAVEEPTSAPIPGWIGLTDAFRALHADAEDVGTFHAFKGTTTGEKIDHILVTPGTKVWSAGIDSTSREGRFPSDHFPVTAMLTLGR